MEIEALFGGTLTELEILEFIAGGNSYGVSIGDIKEILPFNRKPTPIPNSHASLEGIIKPRDFLITIINFASSLGLSDAGDNKNEMLIVTGFNDMNIAFHVDSVSGIHIITRSDIKKPGKKLSTSMEDLVIGIVTRDDRCIELIDLKKIIININPEIEFIS